MEQVYFSGWNALARTLIVGVLAYVSLIVLLRISGKRTLSKMNAFDLVVTVALGSTLATILISKDVSLAQGVLAFALLIFMQWVVTWSSVRARWVRQLATGEPAMLVHRGALLPTALRRLRVTEDEVRAAVREAGHASLGEIEAVVLETDGTFSVVPHQAGAGNSSLEGVKGPAGESESQ
jgi:uncharacterized membrane protein YcaP (DUF421 family)